MKVSKLQAKLVVPEVRKCIEFLRAYGDLTSTKETDLLIIAGKLDAATRPAPPHVIFHRPELEWLEHTVENMVNDQIAGDDLPTQKQLDENKALRTLLGRIRHTVLDLLVDDSTKGD
jgi:hypothetical protein